MNYSKNESLRCYDECKKLLEEHTLPLWDEIPALDLYMDQVVELVNRYIASISLFANESSVITRPMINNYVKLKMMPAPVKKKYSRMHLAYIIVICALKQSLNISTVQKILPIDIPEDEVKIIYNSFVENQIKAFKYVSYQAEKIADPIFTLEDANPERINDLILQVASSANIYKCLMEKIAGFIDEK